MRIAAAALSAVLALPAVGAEHFVSTTGSDQAGSGTREAPWGTIAHGISRLQAGDVLTVLAGEYAGRENSINSRVAAIPSGTADHPTVIRADPPLSVRLRNRGALKYYDNLLRLDADVSHVVIDGFILDQVDTLYPEFVAAVEGTHNKLLRLVVRREGVSGQYSGWIAVGGTDNLVEDCAGTGAARYGFFTGGPDSRAARNIFRRCVARVDYTSSSQPKAAFAAYGNNSGHAMRDVLFQNCIAIDGQRGPFHVEDTYGGFYFPKNATNVTVQGSIVLNHEVGHAGYFAKELQGRNIRVEHSIAWDLRGGPNVAGIRANGASGDFMVFDHLTIGATRVGYYNRDNADARVLSNSLFQGIDALSAPKENGWTTFTHNAFAAAAQSRGAAAVKGGFTLKYLPRVERGSRLENAGSDKQDIGANVTRRYGAPGTRWGEPGYDRLTDEPLWPWPNEDVIRAVFAESNPSPPGAIPAANDTRRGFAAERDAYGKPMTLTRYIWQYLGSPIPGDVYAAPAAQAAPQKGLGRTKSR